MECTSLKAISNDDVTLFNSDVTDKFLPPVEFFTNYTNGSNLDLNQKRAYHRPLEDSCSYSCSFTSVQQQNFEKCANSANLLRQLLNKEIDVL